MKHHQLTTAQAKEVLRQMIMSREGDRRSGIYVRQGKSGFHVSSAGHEAIAAVALNLTAEDYIVPYYRDRALVQAVGFPIIEFARDLLAKGTGFSRGRSMTGHWTLREKNIFSHASPTGAQCLPAAGMAWAMQLRRQSAVAICGIGEAATREGEFYEAVCFAIERKLPVVFLVMDNKYGISTKTESMMPFRLDVFDKNIFVHVNGSDAEDVYEKSAAAIAKARHGDGATILWCSVDRLDSHTSSDDQRVYRSEKELSCLVDPIQLLADKLIARLELTATELEQMNSQAAAEIEAVYQQAANESAPAADSLMTNLYSTKIDAYPPLKLSTKINEAAAVNLVGVAAKETTKTNADDSSMRMVDAINQTLRAGLAKNSEMIIFGEDVADPKGGVFNLTKGLSTEFPLQVFNSPLSEATIVGAGVGMAAARMRPVFEIQYCDFITPALNQLFNQVATLRWRSNGDWSCPLVLYTTYGAYLPGGALWHSQSNESMIAHIPGIRIAIPSNAQDAAGLFWSALHDDDPSLIFVPKHLLFKRYQIDKCAAIPFGKGAIRCAGTDVTVVTWGNCVELVEQAEQELKANNISVEIIDLRTIVPCDWQLIEQSVKKTGRLVVVHEDSRTAGFGGTIISEITCNAERFYWLNSPPQLVAGEDVHIGFNPVLEYASLPSVQAIIAAVQQTME